MDSVNEFWHEVRKEKMAKSDFDFSDFIFTEFLMESFWLENEERKFSVNVSFGDARFLGNVAFEEIQFLKDADFTYAQFSGITSFVNVKFSGKTLFNRSRFFGESFWSNISLLGNEEITFRSTYFPDDHIIVFEDWNIERYIIFLWALLPSKFQFLNFKFDNVIIQDCSLSKVEFTNCQFRKIEGRIALANDVSKDYKNLSNTYRQLKKNFMDAKDWENAGDAYRSEMYIKRKLIWLGYKDGQYHKMINWCIMGLHEHLSGYQQSIALAFLWLMILLITSPMLIFMIGFFHQPCFSNTVCWNQIVQAGITSLNASLPVVGKISTEGYSKELYFYLVFERLFSVVLITFFVLAMRARLRQ
ncbi:hypothetical protein FNH22_21935 [Fulvivirga sp. M361]|uniref:pentapeptide repeat-containing protein n=1 Tax=Fulvivirga sp. M361 TaxID=2594266 RepID=UPI00117A9801|nr:pentapeptide repeat-containing protein [Fulvivirga sp. M361]TRX52376.1 hypothetical protein FNH22_21935 [Fulvivirga sp. M361]